VTGRRPVVLAMLAGAALMLLAEGRPWVRGRVADGLVGASEIAVPGSGAAPGLLAVTLVVAAGAVVVATATERIARLAGAVLLAASLTVLALASSVLRDPAGSLRAHALSGGTLTTPEITQARTLAWVWPAVAGALVVGLGAGVTLVRAGRWRSGRSRYERPAAGEPPAGASDPMWDALSRGEDPTD